MKTGKIYADRPDVNAIESIFASPGEFFNLDLGVVYKPRVWWKFWSPAYEVELIDNKMEVNF